MSGEGQISIDKAGRIDFVPLTAGDLPLILRWLAEPHVKRFYPEPFDTLEGAADYYGLRIDGDEPCLQHLARLDGAPFGFIQCYRLLDYPDYAALVGVEGGIGVDLYIGDPALVGRGLGRAMLAAYLRMVASPAYPDEPRAYIAHAFDNAAALACSLSVGFKPVREVVEDGVLELLLCLERGDLLTSKH
jgi:RimJ/RimL family protein N-acetyltransferase